jgi:hypothetical protein
VERVIRQPIDTEQTGPDGPDPAPFGPRNGTTAAIPHTMRVVLRDLEMVSHAPVSNPDADHRGGGDPLFPPGEPNPPHIVFLERYLHCHTDRSRQSVRDEAEEALRRLTHRTPPPVDSPAWQEQVGRDNGTVREIAARWGISASYAHQLTRRYRQAA